MVEKTSKKKQDEGFDKQIDDFAEEIGQLGNKIGKNIEHQVKSFEKNIEEKTDQLENWYDRKFGIAGPLISSFFVLIVLRIFLEIMYWTDEKFMVFKPLSVFLGTYLLWFFLIILVFSYLSYISRKYYKIMRWITPVTGAVSIYIVMWILIKLVTILYQTWDINVFSTFVTVLNWIHIPIAILVLIIGYLVVVISDMIKPILTTSHEDVSKPLPSKQDSSDQEEYRRLFRSGKNKILGGVCGGIGEYLKIDPTIIRLIWIAVTIVSMGSFILAYLIVWVVIPRNPDHHW